MPDSSRSITLNTLGRLRAHRHRISGWCLDCSALYRIDQRDNPPSSFDIGLNALIAQRSAGALVIHMAPVPCPRCGGTGRRSGSGRRGKIERLERRLVLRGVSSAPHVRIECPQGFIIRRRFCC